MSKTIVAAGMILIAGLAIPSFAQGVSEAAGKVVDRDGNPIQGAKVSFAAASKPDVFYDGTTNKKGRYFVAGLFTGKAQEMWIMKIEAEGFLPVSVRVESRSVNRVLIGDVMDVNLARGKTPPQIPIVPLGKATVNWTMGPREELEKEWKDAAQAEAVATVEAVGEGGNAQPKVERDPWDEALILVSEGDLEGSLEPFAEAIEAAPEDAERHEAYAKVLFRLERTDEAQAEAARAVELDPTRLDAHMLLYSIHDAAEDGAAVRSTLEAAAEALPENTRVLERLGHVLLEQGDSEAAIEVYDRITEIDPGNAGAWMALANVYAEAGRLEESQAAYEKLAELDSENPHQTFYNLGALIMKQDNASQEDIKRAIEAFRKAIELKPDYPKALKELGSALLMVGDRPAALEAYRSYVKVAPDAPDAPSMSALIGALEKSLGQ